MPLIVRRFCTSTLLILLFTVFISAQQTAADQMRERVAKAKAFIAVKNYNAAIFELENIRRETKDSTLTGVLNVLLMNSYLEQGDYRRAQDFLKELSDPKTNQNNAANYFAVAGQVVKGARNQLERYRALGLSVSDRSLPLEAAVDLEKMRETLELIIEQSKVLGKEKNRSPDAMALLEESTGARGSLAKDDYDATRWKNEAADAREMMASSRSVVVNAVNLPATETPTSDKPADVPKTDVQNNAAQPAAQTVFKPVPTSAPAASMSVPVVAKKTTTDSSNAIDAVGTTANQKPAEAQSIEFQAVETAQIKTESPVNPGTAVRSRLIPEENSENAAGNGEKSAEQVQNLKSNAPLEVGSLIEYATQKSNPIYPAPARNMRMTGVVRVELIIDEAGQVAEVQKTSGPTLLQRAATDAVKKWKFKPFTRDGEPVKAIGFVNFNFNL